MESSINSDLIRELLKKLSSDQVTEAELRMRELSKNDAQFLPILLAIIEGGEQQQSIKTYATTYLNQLFISKLNKQSAFQIQRSIINLLLSCQINGKNKMFFQKSIVRSLEFSTLDQKSQWIRLINTCLANVDFYDIALMVITCIAEVENAKQFLQQAITRNYELILSIQVHTQNAYLIIKMLKMWNLIIKKFKQDKQMRKFLWCVFSSQKFQHLIKMVYDLQAQEHLIICLTNSARQLNSLKKEAANLHKKILSLNRNRAEDSFLRILNFTKLFVAKISQTLRTLASKKNIIQSTNSRNLTINLLAIIRLYLKQQPSDFDIQDAITFQNAVVFPFLITEETEKRSFEQNPQEFHELAFDCCNMQTFGVLKTEAAKLLCWLGDLVSESSRYSLNRAIDSILYKFGHPFKQDFEKIQFLELQTALLVISIFSDQLPDYNQERQAILKILTDEKMKLLSPFELSRAFILVSFSYQCLMQHSLLGGWILYGISYQEHPTTRLCALEFVKKAIEHCFNQEILAAILEVLQNERITIIWQIIYRVIEFYYSSLSEHSLSYLIHKLFKRLENQLEFIKQQKDLSGLLSCFNAFVCILCHQKATQHYSQPKRNLVITLVTQIIQFYQLSVQYDIDDEVVSVATHLLKIMNNITPVITKCTTSFINQFNGQKAKYSARVYYKFFNQVLMKADFQRDIAVLLQIGQVLIQTIRNSSQKLLEDKKRLKHFPGYRLAISNALIVLQNFITLFAAKLILNGYPELIKQVREACVGLLLPIKGQENVQRTTSATIIYSRILNTLFMCHMHERNDQVYNYLENLKDYRPYHGYDTKVLVMCIDKQIFHATNLGEVIRLLTILKSIVQSSEQKDQRLLKMKKENKNDPKVQKQLQRYEDFDKITQIDSPFKTDKPIYLLLVQLFANMKKLDNNVFNAFLKDLPLHIFHYFDQYISFDSLEKKQRTYWKVIGIKNNNDAYPDLNSPQKEQPKQVENSENDQSEDQKQQIPKFKRQRMRLRAEKKKTTYEKNKKIKYCE